jgi:hypothetical protein
VPSSRLLSLLIICIALPGWLTSLLHKKREGDSQQDSTQPEKVDETGGLITDVNKAMEELRLYSFQREVLSSALTTIYEAEVKGILKVSERDKLAEPYKKDLQFLDEKIEERRKVSELLNLQKEKKELQTSYSQKIIEIDRKIEELRSLIGSLSQLDLQTLPTSENLPENPPPPSEPSPSEPFKETNNTSLGPTVEISGKTKNKTEQKIEALREEVLRAIDRLEQIESEG